MRKAITAICGTLLTVLAASLLGCASTESSPRDTKSQGSYQTGSNIPQRDRAGSKVQTLDSDSLQTPLPPPIRPPAGAGGG